MGTWKSWVSVHIQQSSLVEESINSELYVVTLLNNTYDNMIVIDLKLSLLYIFQIYIVELFSLWLLVKPFYFGIVIPLVSLDN